MEACCIGNSCLKETGFSAVVDSGTSFTFLPNEVYERIAKEVLSLHCNLLGAKIVIGLCLISAIFYSLISESMLQSQAIQVIHGNIATSPG